MGRRERRLAAVRAQLKKADAKRDPSPVLTQRAFREAVQLDEVIGDDDADVEAAYVLGLWHWYRCRALPPRMGAPHLDAAVRRLTPCFIAGMSGLPEPLLPRLAEQAVPHGIDLLAEAGGATGQALDATVGLWRRIVGSVPTGDADRPKHQSRLAAALAIRFERTGVQADLDEALATSQAAVDAAAVDHPGRAMCLSNLAGVLRVGFEGTGTVAYLSAAIDAIRGAVDAAGDDDSNRPGYLSNLSEVLRLRFERMGTQLDLDEAIGACRTAAVAIAADDPAGPYIAASLGSALQRRFERAGARADIDAAVEAYRVAVAAAPADDPSRAGSQHNLGAALRLRFERAGAGSDLDDAVSACQDAVDATPAGYRARAWRLSDLGTVLRYRFERTGARADINAAVSACRDAVHATHPGDADAPMYLSNLGGALLDRFACTGRRADLKAAVGACQGAVDAAPDGHPGKARYLSNLGGALLTRFEHTAAREDHDAALAAYARASEVDSAAPTERIRAARMAASLAARPDPGQAAGLLEAATGLLAQVAPRQLERGDQQYALGGFAGLANDAAALVLASGGDRVARALGLLETGRGILLSQALETHSDLTELRRQHPALATRFAELRDHLDQPAGDSAPAGTLASGTSLAAALPGNAADRQHLAGELTSVLGQIRALEGFGSFGLPPGPDELLSHAAAGPVVTFNVSTHRSDALLLTTAGITCLELPGLAYETLTEQVSSFHEALRSAFDPDNGLRQSRAAQGKLLEILGWLWDVAAGPVMDALGYHQSPTGTWPRVWWSPGGLLGLLPIHAAGHHGERAAGDRARRTVMDRVISSWTPTIRALGYAQQHAHGIPGPADRALIVAMPVTPGMPDGELPYAAEEFTRVHALLPAPVVLAEPGIPHSGSLDIPTKANVLAHLPECSIAHFLCHGFSDPADPSKSLLLLHDHDSAPLTVASLAPVELGRAQLAYLSACDTALTGTDELIDEAIHLTTAFQLAGFPHVIGTLWEIKDQFAIAMAETFYATLRTNAGALETSQAARALHDAVRAARDEYPRAPSLWAAYIHAGA